MVKNKCILFLVFLCLKCNSEKNEIKYETFYKKKVVVNQYVPIKSIVKNIKKDMSLGEYAKIMADFGIKESYHGYSSVEMKVKNQEKKIFHTEYYDFIIGKDTTIKTEFIKEVEEGYDKYRLNHFCILPRKAKEFEAVDSVKECLF